MPIRLSAEAELQITNKDVTKYVECKLYDSSGVYKCDLPIQSASYSKSRQFGVSTMNIKLPNQDKLYTTGTYNILRDYIIVLIEGYVTATATDKIPTFMGRVSEMNQSISSGDNTLDITCYGYLQMLQRSDINKTYVANTIYVENEILSPVIDTTSGRITAKSSDDKYVKIEPYDDNKLYTIMSDNIIYVNDKMMTVVDKVITPTSKDGDYLMVFYTGSGTFTLNETIKSIDGLSFEGVYKGVETHTQLGLSYLKIQIPSGVDITKDLSKLPKNNMVIIGQSSGVTKTVNSFYYVKLSLTTDARIFCENLLINDLVHTGVVDKFRATNQNWAAFKTHSVNVRTIGGDITLTDRYSGYEIKEELGIVKLNLPVKINEKQVIADYYYYPVGLYVEDVLTDLITIPDELLTDIIKNGKFTQSLTGWTLSQSGISSSNYGTIYTDGIKITSYINFPVNSYISIKQSVNLVNGYNNNIKFNIHQSSGLSATYGIFINGTSISSGGSFTSLTRINVNYLHTLATGNYDFEIRIYNLNNTDGVRINDIKLQYNPSKIANLSKSNLYCKSSIEDGNTDAHSLTKASDITTTPKFGILTNDIVNSSTLIYLKDTTNFESTGYVKIDNEIISYSAKTATTLTISTRGYNSTTQTDHYTGKRVWEVLPKERVWFMKYNNIIPNSYNATASDYDTTNGITMLVSGNFTITGGGVFKEAYYREGIVVLDSAATTSTIVSLKAGVDFLFNQLQNTSVETPYILIDYMNIKTRYDAIEEIKSMLAPNYIIDEIVRKNGSIYQPYIRGRYLYQKSTAEYNLGLISSIAYNKPTNTYNRVKMFGKSSNPENYMYNDKTNIFNINDIDTQYIEGIGYKYRREDGDTYIFTNDVDMYPVYSWETTYLGSGISVEAVLYNKVYPYFRTDWVDVFEHTKDRFIITTVVYNGGSYICAQYIKYHYSRYYKTDVYERAFYNVYLLKNVSDRFIVGDTIVNGSNSGVIKGIVYSSTETLCDCIIYVEMSTSSTTFSDGTPVTCSTKSGTINMLYIKGVTSNVNFNSIANPSYDDKFTAYTFSTYDTNKSISLDKINTISTKVYLNDIEITSDNSTDTVSALDPLLINEGWWGNSYQESMFGTNWRHRYHTFDSTGIYINSSLNEYNKNKLYIVGGISAGTVTLEKLDSTTGIFTKLYTLNYVGEPNVDITFGRLDNTLSYSLYRGNITTKAQCDNKGDDEKYNDNLANLIKDMTHVRFTRNYSYNLPYVFYGDSILFNKSEFDKTRLKPGDVAIKVDSEFSVRMLAEYTDYGVDTLTRIRGNSLEDRNNHISIISQTPIDDITICIIDLGEVKDIGIIDIQAGFLYRPLYTGDMNKYDTEFKYTLLYSDLDEKYINLNDIDFSVISESTEDISISTGDVNTLTSSELGENFKARYIKINVSATSSTITEGKETEIVGTEDKDRTYMRDYYGAAINSIAIYGTGIITSEKFVNADVINLYKDTTVYEQLNTQELVDTYAQANLNEFQKDNTTVTVTSPIGTHYDMGMTVNLTDTENSINQNYFIEEVSTDNGAVTLTLARYN
ncbi:MAG: hypothetical protein PHN69_04185 [Candidatus Pacebacteria bacterium]|nr:hypothetical protein [Candidatus Paceibacterota bacterium]